MVIVCMDCHRAAAGYPVWGGLWPDHVCFRDPRNTASFPFPSALTLASPARTCGSLWPWAFDGVGNGYRNGAPRDAEKEHFPFGAVIMTPGFDSSRGLASGPECSLYARVTGCQAARRAAAAEADQATRWREPVSCANQQSDLAGRFTPNHSSDKMICFEDAQRWRGAIAYWISMA